MNKNENSKTLRKKKQREERRIKVRKNKYILSFNLDGNDIRKKKKCTSKLAFFGSVVQLISYLINNLFFVNGIRFYKEREFRRLRDGDDGWIDSVRDSLIVSK